MSTKKSTEQRNLHGVGVRLLSTAREIVNDAFWLDSASEEHNLRCLRIHIGRVKPLLEDLKDIEKSFKLD